MSSDLEKYEKAMKDLEDFDKMMERLKPYLKSPGIEVKNNMPYEVEEFLN